MEKKLTLKNKIFVGTMLFGMLFGAGNLIFPVYMGQQAGRNIWPAILGFLVTGMGLPLLGVAAIGLSRSDGVFDLAKKVGRPYAYFFTILLYLIIGPFFAVPRLATTSYQIGIEPFIHGSGHGPLVLAIFSVLFYAISWWFCRKPSKIMVYIGKFLTPLFLLFLAVFMLVALLKPMGGLDHSVQVGYQQAPFISGFTEGYNTVDALAALAFGITVINVIRQLGIEDPKQIAKGTLSSGTLSILLMGLIYTLLALLGTMSLAKFPVASNGGIVLAETANYYFKGLGSVFLAIIVILACLKTSIGLITSFGETFSELFPKWSYEGIVLVASILPMIFANVGLTRIITYATPILFFIYPLAMTLIITGVLAPLLHIDNPWFYRLPVLFTIIPAILDGLNSAPKVLLSNPLVSQLLHIRALLPLSAYGLSWVLPALVAFILGLVFCRRPKATH